MKFDVLTENWIPVVRLDGRRESVGLLTALLRAHELTAIRDPSPLVEFGLFRLLVAFVHDALLDCGEAPGEPEALKEMLSKERFDAGILTAYAQKCGDVFDLFHPERPFLQSIAAGGGEKPLAALYPAVPSGTNVIHWHHALEQEMGPTTPQAAGLLLTIAPFMTAGGAGLSPSINGAPAIYALPMGKNLFETIVLNLPLSRVGTGGGRVAWRDDRVPGGDRVQATMGESLTWRPRRVRLIPAENGKVDRMLFQAGDSTRLVWTDPNLAYRFEGETQSPVRMREGRPLWRDAGALTLLNQGDGKFSYRRPDVVNDAFAATEKPLRIRVYGMRTDMKMKIFEWAVGELVVPSSVGRSARMGALVRRLMNAADLAGRELRFAIRRLYPREAAGNKAALGRTSERAERGYWNALEPRFGELVLAAGELTEQDADGGERFDAVATPWKVAIRREALRAFEEVAQDFDADGEALERAVVSRARLGAALRKILE